MIFFAEFYSNESLIEWILQTSSDLEPVINGLNEAIWKYSKKINFKNLRLKMAKNNSTKKCQF